MTNDILADPIKPMNIPIATCLWSAHEGWKTYSALQYSISGLDDLLPRKILATNLPSCE